MTTLGTASMVMKLPQSEAVFDEAQVAAVAFLARYGGTRAGGVDDRPAALDGVRLLSVRSL